MATVTGLSGNEIFCLNKKGLSAGELVIGNSVNSMGFLGSLGASLTNVLGGEIPQVTQAIQDGREAALERMIAEAAEHGATGIAGVSSELRAFAGNTEFLFVGTCVHGNETTTKPFSSAGDAQELYCHMDAGYMPVRHVFGNVAYSVGVGGGLMGALKTLARGEIKEYSDIFNKTRHTALARIVDQAKNCGANAVVGIRTIIQPWAGVHEMMMSGTASIHDALPTGTFENPVTSDLTGEELWALATMGYAPVKLIMSTSIFSLGVAGGFLAAFKSFKRGEINELTQIVHEAREIAIDSVKREADTLGVAEIVGVKTYIADLGSNLVEFMAIGTAVNKINGIGVNTATLPVQAIISDKDTWIDGEFGFSLDRKNQN